MVRMMRRTSGKETYLLTVGRRRLTKLARLPHDLVVLGIGGLETRTLALAGCVGGGTKVFEAGLLGVPVEALVGAGLSVTLAVTVAIVVGGGKRHGGQGEQGEDGLGLHVGDWVEVGVTGEEKGVVMELDGERRGEEPEEM